MAIIANGFIVVDLVLRVLYTEPMTTSSGYLLSVDPGLRACGVALWFDGELLAAGAVRGPADGRGPAVWAALSRGVAAWLTAHHPVDAPSGVVLVETMKVYTQGRSDPADLLELGGVSGAIVGRLGESGWQAEGVAARDWNGQVPAPIRRNRTREWVQERGWWDRVDLNTTARFQEDIHSAIGIGIHRTRGYR